MPCSARRPGPPTEWPSANGSRSRHGPRRDEGRTIVHPGPQLPEPAVEPNRAPPRIHVATSHGAVRSSFAPAMQRRHPRPRRLRLGRRRWALLAALSWVLAFELGPGLHVGLHEWWGHHHHEGDAPHAADHPNAHGPHNLPEHDADARHDHGTRPSDHDAFSGATCQSPLDHGRHSLAHRAIAVLTPPDALPPVDAAPFGGDQPRSDGEAPAHDAEPLTLRARGPPAAMA